jgi:hypothetical protein
MLASLFALTLTAGCSTFGQTTAISANAKAIQTEREAVCSIWKYWSWEDADTDQTIIEAKANNASRKAYCE